MRNALSGAARGALRKLATRRLLLAFDFDGTLAPIVGDPDRAVLRGTTRALLGRLAERLACIVISGRSRADLCRRLDGLPLRELVGNHGIEPWHATRRFARQVARWRTLLQGRLARLPGVVVEDKGLTLAIHYRRAPDRPLARAAVDTAVGSLSDARRIGGKYVVNLLPATAPSKGTALERARAALGCDAALYVGDDDTDEDVFKLGGTNGIIGVRVGWSSRSAAQYYLRKQREIDALLKMLLTAHTRASRDATGRRGARRGGRARPARRASSRAPHGRAQRVRSCAGPCRGGCSP